MHIAAFHDMPLMQQCEWLDRGTFADRREEFYLPDAWRAIGAYKQNHIASMKTLVFIWAGFAARPDRRVFANAEICLQCRYEFPLGRDWMEQQRRTAKKSCVLRCQIAPPPCVAKHPSPLCQGPEVLRTCSPNPLAVLCFCSSTQQAGSHPRRSSTCGNCEA